MSTASAAPGAPAARRGDHHRDKAEAKYIQSIEKLIGKEIDWAEKPAAVESAARGPPRRGRRADASTAGGSRAARAGHG